MDSDNIYPNDGAPWAMPAFNAQEEEKKIDVAKTLLAIPRLNDEVARLDDKIAFYSSTASITGEALADKELFMHTYAAYQIVTQILQGERDEILYRVEQASEK